MAPSRPEVAPLPLFRALSFVLAVPINAIAAIWCLFLGLTVSTAYDRALCALLPVTMARLSAAPFALVVAWFATLPATRVLLRLWPPRVRRARWGCLLLCCAYLVVPTILLLGALFGTSSFELRPSQPRLVTQVFLWGAGASVGLQAGWLLGTGQSVPRGGEILYLRRFGGFGDRAVVGYLLRRMPATVRLVMMRPPGAGLSDWDPLTNVISGFTLGRGLRSQPLFFRARNSDWQDDVRSLVVRARGIVLDVSDLSPAMHTEIALVASLAAANKTVLVGDQGGQASYARLGMPVVTYTRSLRASVPRALALGGLLAFIALVELDLDHLMPVFVAYAQWLRLPVSDEVLGGGGFIYAIPIVWLLFRRSLDADSKSALDGQLSRLLPELGRPHPRRWG